MSITVAEDL